MELEQAIRISKIICQAPEERLPMILSVLEKAEVSIGGLAELEEWKALKDQAFLIDVREFVSELERHFYGDSAEIRMRIPVKEFSEYCKGRSLKPTLVKRLLCKHGYIEPTHDGDKLGYTETVWKDGKAIRCVVVWIFPQNTEVQNG